MIFSVDETKQPFRLFEHMFRSSSFEPLLLLAVNFSFLNDYLRL